MDVFRSPAPVEWRFPVATAHDGLPLGNGLFGPCSGAVATRCGITINRADYWHHETGFDPGPEATWDNLLAWASAGNERELIRVFEGATRPGR